MKESCLLSTAMAAGYLKPSPLNAFTAKTIKNGRSHQQALPKTLSLFQRKTSLESLARGTLQQPQNLKPLYKEGPRAALQRSGRTYNVAGEAEGRVEHVGGKPEGRDPEAEGKGEVPINLTGHSAAHEGGTPSSHQV